MKTYELTAKEPVTLLTRSGNKIIEAEPMTVWRVGEDFLDWGLVERDLKSGRLISCIELKKH